MAAPFLAAQWGLARQGEAGWAGGSILPPVPALPPLVSARWGLARWGGPYNLGGVLAPIPPGPPAAFMRVDQAAVEIQYNVPNTLAPVRVCQVTVEIHFSIATASSGASTGRWFPELVGDDFDIGAGEI